MSEDRTQESQPMTARQWNNAIFKGLPHLGIVCGEERSTGDAGSVRVCSGALRLMSPTDVCVLDPEGDLYLVVGHCSECGALQRVHFNIIGPNKLHEEAMKLIREKIGVKLGQTAPDKPLEKKPESKLDI